MTLSQQVTPEVDGSSDAELILAVRAGDLHAYGTLYERHLSAARAHARQLTPSYADADDLVAEAFAKIFTILRSGRGPDRAFRAYLLTTVRNGLYQRMRGERRIELSDDMARHDQGVPWSDPVEAALNSSLAAQAFATLPERWQTVLWQSEVEQRSTTDIGARLGLRPNAVAALAYRAREGLRQAYLQAHLAGHPDEACRPTVHRLGGWTRGKLSPGDTAVVQAHLVECARCRGLADELADVNGGIRGLLAPLASSLAGAASLGAVASGGSTTAVGSALGWVFGTHLGQAAAAVLTAAVVGGTAVAAGTGAIGPGRHAAAPVAAQSAAGVHPDRIVVRRAAAPGKGESGKRPKRALSPGQAKKATTPPARGKPAQPPGQVKKAAKQTGAGSSAAKSTQTGQAKSSQTGHTNQAEPGQPSQTGKANQTKSGQTGQVDSAKDKPAPPGNAKSSAAKDPAVAQGANGKAVANGKTGR